MTSQFLPGNEFWKTRSTHGRNPIFAAPVDLMAACMEYFEWVQNNPLYEVKPFAFQGVVTQEAVPKMRAMSLGGLCIFLDISRPTWSEYRKKPDFSGVCEQVEEIIRAQKFEGASADLLNASIIARDLGLADKSELTGRDGAPLVPELPSDNELARRIAFLLSKGLQGSGS